MYAKGSRLSDSRASIDAQAFNQKWPAIALALVIIVALASAANAQTFKVLYRFNGASDGANPWGGLVLDRAGNLYGTTSCGPCMSAYGTIFKIDAKGHESTVYNFTGGADGGEPDSTLIQDSAGYLYGTTYRGGAYGLGTVFRVDTAGNLTVLFSFSGYSTGYFPFGGLVRDAEGNLYGATQAGGSYYGTVFKLDASGNETVLHSFTGTVDGGLPTGLVADNSGNLYGATSTGGPNGGTLFEVTLSGAFSTLYGFRNNTAPVSALILRDGKLYGTAMGGSTGSGMVFNFNTLIGKGKDLYDFKGTPDGSQPVAGLVADSDGNLYGTTMTGGQSGNGTIFKLDKAGNETVLYSFSGGTDGSSPQAGLIMDSAGNLYGTTYYGGHAACYCGVVFKLTP